MTTPREARAAARQRREENLQFPNIGLGRADLIRSRSPSPSAPGSFIFPPPAKKSAKQIEEEQFHDALSFNTATMATPEQLAAIREQLRNELRNEVRNELRNETVAAAAAIPDAVRKKPEIPPFDKKHIDIWIKRTENAFVRANISAINEKFAFLETKFPVGFDPRIDEYLYGDATDTSWASFITYLRKEYGATIQQRASIFIDGFKRDGLRPSQYAAALDEKTKDVTLDDVKKEMLLREIPADVRRMLQERTETLTFKDVAKIADNYFDANGRPKNASQNPTVSQVSKTFSRMQIPEPADTTDDDDDAEISAVNARKKPFKGRPAVRGQQNRNSNSWRQNHNSAPPTQVQNAPGRNRENRPPSTPKQPQLCYYHQLYGDEAQTCKQGCPKFPKVLSNYKAGRQT